MGERVFVRTSPVQPIGGGGDDFAPDPRIDYAKPDVNPHFPTFRKALAWLHYAVDRFYQGAQPVAAALRELVSMIVEQLGGRRQVVFAMGMMFACFGFGCAIAHDGLPVFFMSLGGFFMGAMIPLRHGRRDGRP